VATKLKLSPSALTSSLNKNAALMKQIMYYHFATGSGAVKGVYPTWSMKAGLKLNTMFVSATTKAPYQLSVTSVVGTKALLASVGTSAYTVQPNIK
jgi:hypothetical protein